MAAKRQRPLDPEVHGSRPMTRAERWERSRCLCLPELCMYRYACPTAGPRPRYVRPRDCFRQRPETERPAPALSDFAVRLLAGYSRTGTQETPRS